MRIKAGGRFFSYRLSQGSSMFKELKPSGIWIDSFTVENIPVGFPLSMNRPTSFWSEEVATRELTAIGYEKITVTKSSQTYLDATSVEYLEVNAVKP